MLHLPTNNTLLEATLIELNEAWLNNSPLVVDRIVSDFDHTALHLLTPDNENRQWVYLSIVLMTWSSLCKCSNEESLLRYIQSKFDKYNNDSDNSNVIEILPKNQTIQGYNLTLRLDISKLNNQSITDLSLLKTHIMSYPFQLSFQEFNQLSTMEVAPSNDAVSTYRMQYREDENIYIQPSNDRITVIFETIFNDETDKIFSKVFLQEFVDSRKRNRSIQSAPQVLFSNTPPREIINITTNQNKDVDSKFITFVLFPRHFSNDEIQFKAVCKLLQFRHYFHYHIKCSKAFMHSRMRFRVNNFIKVLNRAKFDSNDDEENGTSNSQLDDKRRTITGRKMVY